MVQTIGLIVKRSRGANYRAYSEEISWCKLYIGLIMKRSCVANYRAYSKDI